MRPISRITLNDYKREKQQARERLALGMSSFHERQVLDGNWLTLLAQTPLARLDRKIKHGEDLTFEEAFCGFCYILAATNVLFFDTYRDSFRQACGNEFTEERAIASGVAFAQLMAAKESFRALTPEEVAGMAAAAMLDPVVFLDLGPVIETSGMGGDIGFRNGDRGDWLKTINASTLGAIVLSALGSPAVKHGSYSNTSAVGSTEAIEKFGALTSFSNEEEVHRVREVSNFHFTDAHGVKTIHDLSHLIMMETINHVVGPMTAPLHPGRLLTKVMGVNEKVHPEVIARAYNILHEKGIRTVGGVAVVTGLGPGAADVDPNDAGEIKPHVILDEVSPYSSVIAFAYGDRFLGNFRVTPEDFGAEFDLEQIQIQNTVDEIQAANARALQGKDRDLVSYLAMNAAVGLFAEHYLHLPNAVTGSGPNREYLRECYERCRGILLAGEAWNVLRAYVEATGGTLC